MNGERITVKRWISVGSGTGPDTSAPVRWEQLSRFVHLGLYVLVVAGIMLGLWNAWVRGEHVFSLFQISAFDGDNKGLRKWAGDQHKLLANTLLIVSAAHGLVGLAHHFIWRDGVLQRMLPSRFAAPSAPLRKGNAP